MNKFLSSVLIFIVSSCFHGATQKKYNYEEIKNVFKEKFISHFPQKLNSTNYKVNLVSPESMKYANRCGVILSVKDDEKNIMKIKNEIKDSIVSEVKPSNNCLLFVDLFDNKEAGDVLIEHYNEYCKNDFIPIPNFLDLLSIQGIFTKDGILTDDFTLYMLRSEPGKFLSPKKLTEGIGLTKKWKNGYSRGIAINEKENVVIYWLEMW